MKPYRILPNHTIAAKATVSRAFLTAGIHDMHGACEHILRLPYGRTSEKSDYMLVLSEGQGTCSTKHALIAALGLELMIDVQLTLGIYLMTESNTPGVGKILAGSEFDCLPEAHCYLTYHDQRIDLTGLSNSGSGQIQGFLHEERIGLSQIGDYKKAVHQSFIKQWMPADKFERIWSLREACIDSIGTPKKHGQP